MRILSLLIIGILYFTPIYCQKIVDVSNDTSSVANIKPIFPGGENGLKQYLTDSIRYPLEKIDEKYFGRVFVGFKIDTLGKLKDIKILRSLNPLLDKEALRLVSDMPIWSPGFQNGKPVEVSFQVPVKFNYDDYKIYRLEHKK